MADYTYEQIMTALQNADKAGDTEAATQLAQMASAMKQPEAAAPSLTDSLKRGVGLAGRALVTGASAIPNAVLDFVTGAGNVGLNLAGYKSQFAVPSQEQQKAMTALGVPEAQTLPEKAAMGGIEAITGGGVQAGLAGASKVPALATLTKNLPTQLAAAGAAGTTAPLAYTGIKDVTGSDLAASIGSLGLSTVAAGLAGKAANAGLKEPMPVVSMNDVKQNATRAYTAMADAGVAVKPQSALNMVDTMKNSLEDAGYVAQSSPKVGNLLSKFEEIIGTQRVPFTTLEKMRSMATNLKTDADKDTARLAGRMVGTIDDYLASMTGKDVIAGQGKIDEAVKNVMSARKDWRNMSRATVLEDILNKAEAGALNPTASESELIRQGFIALAKNKNKFSQFSPDEQAAIRRVASGTPFDKVLTLMGRMNPERSAFLQAGAGAGAVSGNPYILGAAGLGYTADKLQGYLRNKAATDAVSGILSGTTPTAQPQFPFRGLLSIQQQQP